MAVYAGGGHLEFWKMLNILQIATKLILIPQTYKTKINNKSLQQSPLQGTKKKPEGWQLDYEGIVKVE